MVSEAQKQKALDDYLNSGIIPPARILDIRGRGMNNPLYAVVNNYITAEQNKATASAALAASGIELRSISLDRTTADIVSGKRNIPTRQLNPEQRHTLASYNLRNDVVAGRITPAEYSSRQSQIDQALQQEGSARTIQFAQRAKSGLDAAAIAEEQRFANLATVDYAAQQQAQTKTLEKVASDISKAGFDPANLVQAKGKPNVNRDLKINTPAEIKQSEFARAQVPRTVESVLPSYGSDLFDSSGKRIARNVKQSGGFSVLKTQTQIPVKITGISEGAVFSIAETRKEVQGPMRETKLPSFVKNAFYTFDDFIGPKKPETFTGLVGKDFFAKDEFVKSVDFLGVPSKVSYRLDDITLENFGRGFYEGGILPIAQAVFAPKPIFSDIFGRTESENKALQKTVDKIKKFVPAGPVASGEIIGQLITGQPIRGTGRGLGYDVGSVAFDIATIALPSKKGLPLQVEGLRVPVGETNVLVGGRLTIGYGKLSVPVITNIGKSIRFGRGKTIYSNLEKTAFPNISPTGRGFEFLTLTKTNADVLASDTALNILQKAGKVTPLGRRFIEVEKEAVGLVRDIKLKPTQKQPLLTSEGLVSESLEPGAETRVFVEDILPRLLGFKGGQAQRIQVRQKFITGTGREGLTDFDIDYGDVLFGTTRAKRATERAGNLLSGVAGTNRRFVSTGTKLFSITLDEGGFVFVGNRKVKFDVLSKKEQQRIAQQLDNKVFELLTKKDATRPSGSPSTQNLGQVGGFKYPKDILKIKSPLGETIKVKGLRFQILTKIASAATLQGPKGEKFKGSIVPFLKTEVKTKEELEAGFRIGPFIPRFKDVVDQPFLFRELGTQGIESGKYVTKGKKLIERGEEIKTLFPEIDFGKPSGSIIVQGERSTISNIGESVKSFSQPGISLSRLVGIDMKETKPSRSLIQPTKILSIGKSVSTPSYSNLLNSIGKSVYVSKTTSVSSVSSKSSLGSIANLPRFSIISSKSPSRSASRSTPSIQSPNIFSPKSPSITSPGSPFSPGSPGSPRSPSPPRSPGITPIKSPPRSSVIRLPIKTQPVTSSTVRVPKLGLLLTKFDQFKSQRLPSYAKRKFFVASPADPFRAGVFAPKGVKELRSSSPKIFRQIDINLARARRNKRAFDPLNAFKIAKSGKYVYSSKNLLGKFSKFRI